MEWSNGRRRARAITDSIHDLASRNPGDCWRLRGAFHLACVAPARPKRRLPIVSRFGAGPVLARQILLVV
jgi:hypothetical protein